MKKIKVLELFAGSRSIGQAAEELGYEVFSVDWEKFEDIDLSIDIGELNICDIPFIPDVIWASPDCATYSMAAGRTHRIKPNFAPRTEYAAKCDTVNQHWLTLIKEWQEINPSLIYYIENPRAMLRKMPWMQELPIRHTVWYCQYSKDKRAKPTDIWTNNKAWNPKPECHNKKKDRDGNVIHHCHHESAPRGSKTGTQGKKGSYERSKIPAELCIEILKAKRMVRDSQKSLF